MSSTSCTHSDQSSPAWLWDYLGVKQALDGDQFDLHGQKYVVKNGIPRASSLLSNAQAQTEETFGFKWKKRDTFESPASLARMREWLVERYGDLAKATWLAEHGKNPLLIDAGCGA